MYLITLSSIFMLWTSICSGSLTPANGHHNHWGAEQEEQFRRPRSPINEQTISEARTHRRVNSEVLPPRTASVPSAIDSDDSISGDSIIDAVAQLFADSGSMSPDLIRPYISEIIEEDDTSPTAPTYATSERFRRIKSGGFSMDNDHDRNYISSLAVRASHKALEEHKRKIDSRFTKKKAFIGALVSVVCTAAISISASLKSCN